MDERGSGVEMEGKCLGKTHGDTATAISIAGDVEGQWRIDVKGR